MVTIRLARGGTNKRPFYHIVVTDSRNPRDGRYIERIGFYNPVAAGKDVPFKISNERIEYWLSKGAQPSDRVASLVKSHANTANGVEAKPAKQANENTQTNNSAEESSL